MPKSDITALKDIKHLVNTFYDRVRQDDLIGPVFERVVEDRWPQHLEKMYRFWQTVLLNEHTYHGSPFPPHSKLPIEKEHFDRWLSLFSETVRELFSGEKADEALWRAEKMAQMFQFKIDHFQSNPNKTPL